MGEAVTEVPIEDETVKRFCEQTYSFGDDGLCMVEPYHQVFPKGYLNHHKAIQEFEVFDDDVWLCTFPKSGARWTKEILWCLRNNMDIEKAKTIQTDVRVPYFEFSCVAAIRNMEGHKLSYEEVAENLERPRTFQTHLSYDMLPKQLHKNNNAKIICVLRNPRDVCVSLLNHVRLTENYTGDLATIVDIFLGDVGPYYAPYFKHVLGYWKERNRENVLIIFYEDMKKNIYLEIKKLAEFLDIKVSDEEIARLADHTSFKNMKANPMCNMEEAFEFLKKLQNNQQEGNEFIHKGKTGSWRENFDEETIKRFEEWEKKWLRNTDLSFVYEL